MRRIYGMNGSEIIKYIDDGANFYCRQLGNASHMEFTNNGYYSIIYPKAGQEGGTSLFHVTLENLNDDEALKIINQIMERKIFWGSVFITLIRNIYEAKKALNCFKWTVEGNLVMANG
jgi:hypothetical protein